VKRALLLAAVLAVIMIVAIASSVGLGTGSSASLSPNNGPCSTQPGIIREFFGYGNVLNAGTGRFSIQAISNPLCNLHQSHR
jgi:hypothetical protein